MTVGLETEEETCFSSSPFIENEIRGFDLSLWDRYPMVSTLYSGPLRIIAGAIQIAVGAIFTILSAFFWAMNRSDLWARNIGINAKEILHGVGNLIRGSIACIPCLGNLLIYLYDRHDQSVLEPVILRRGSDGVYTLPSLNLPWLQTGEGSIRGQELKIRHGNFVIDTKNGIVPPGWTLER